MVHPERRGLAVLPGRGPELEPSVKPYYSEPGIDLYLGDNREVLAALGLMPGDAMHGVELLWGDPPYGMEASPLWLCMRC